MELSRGGIVFISDDCALDTLRCLGRVIRVKKDYSVGYRAVIVCPKTIPLRCSDVINPRLVKQTIPERTCLRTRTQPRSRQGKVFLVEQLRLEKSEAVPHS